MKKIRLVLFLVSLSLVVSLFSSCGGSAMKIEEIFEQIPEFKDTEIDYGGKDFTIMLWGNGDKPQSNDLASEKLNIARLQDEVRRRNNIGKIIWDTVGDWQAVQPALTAKVLAGNAPDIAVLMMNWYFPSVTNNLISEIPDAQKLVDDSILYLDKISLGFLDNKKYYGLLDNSYITNAEGICYNKDLMKKYSLEDPAKLFLEDKWDFETFLKYCEVLSKDTDGDGINDIRAYGCPGLMDGRADAMNFLAANGADIFTYKNNRFDVGLASENAVGGLELMKKIAFDNDYADIELSMDFDRVTGLYKTQKIAMMSMCAWGVGFAESFSAGFVGYPKGPNAGDKYHIWTENPLMITVPNGSGSSKNPANALKVYEQIKLSNYVMEWVDDKGTGLDKDMLENIGAELRMAEAKNKIALTETSLKQWAGRDITEHTYPALRKIINSQEFAPFEGSNEFRFYGKSLFNDIIFGDNDPQGTLKSNHPHFQAIIDRDVNEVLAKYKQE